jgi:hypothetical protein
MDFSFAYPALTGLAFGIADSRRCTVIFTSAKRQP